MATLTSTGNVSLTASTSWSPAQIPVAGDDLIIGAHTLTLDADMTLASLTLNNTSARLAIGGTTRVVNFTNGINVAISTSGSIVTTAIPSGTSLTIRGRWFGVGNIQTSIATSTGGNLTLATIGDDQTAVLFQDTTVQRILTNSWTAGTLTTIGRFDLPSFAQSNVFVTMSGGTWSHQSVGINSLGIASGRFCSLTGTAQLNWTGSVDAQTNNSGSGVFTLASSATGHTIGAASDTFVLRNTASGNFTSIVSSGLAGQVITLNGRWSSRAGGWTTHQTAGAIIYTNQTYTLPSTDYFTAWVAGGSLDVSGLRITSSKGIFIYNFAAGVVSSSVTTLFTCASTAAFFGAYFVPGLESRFVILESAPPTLPAVQDVAAGEVYGYTASPLTGTGLIVDPAVLAAAMTTSLDTISTTSTARIADGVLTRNVSNVEATAGEHTLATVVLSMLEWEISGSDLIIKRTDGTTVHYTKVLSSATGTGDVITGLN